MKPGQIGRSQNERFRSCPSTAVTTQRRPSSMHRRQRLALIRSESAFYTRQAHRARLWPLRDVRFVPACARFQPRPVREAVGAASCTPGRRLGTRPPPCPREKPVHGGAAWALTASGRAHSPSVGPLGYTIPPALPDRRAWRLHALERRPISCPSLAPRGFQRAPACVMTPWPRCAASRTYPF